MARAPRPLPDYLRAGLDVVFVGSNPGVVSAERGHYYAGPGNDFWPLLHEARIVTEALTYSDDARVLEFGIGLTDLVKRPSPSVADLSREEKEAGLPRLRAKLRAFRPRVVCFNGKGIYEFVLGDQCENGLQEERLEDALVFAMPSTSSRNVTYSRAEKLRLFRQLKRIVDRERKRG